MFSMVSSHQLIKAQLQIDQSKLVEQKTGLKVKMQQIWEAFLSLTRSAFEKMESYLTAIKDRICPFSLPQRIDLLLKKIDHAEADFKSFFASNTTKDICVTATSIGVQKRQVWEEAMDQAFVNTMRAIVAKRFDPTHMPKEIALKLAEILSRYGIFLYSNSAMSNPFQTSLDVLKAAFVMQQYALGLRDSCPDFSKLSNLKVLYQKDAIRMHNVALADAAIDVMNQEDWVEKVITLDQRQIFGIVKLLRYINGAIRYLNQTDVNRCGRLLDTAQACLQSIRHSIDNEMAELIYNDLTSFTASKAELYEKQGSMDQAQKMHSKLADLWEECVKLSKDPEKMQARCDNKRTFIEKLTPIQIVEMRQKAIERHLKLPIGRQDLHLLALAWNNCSHAQQNVGNADEAWRCSQEAVKLYHQCKAMGSQDVQLESIITQSERLAKIG